MSLSKLFWTWSQNGWTDRDESGTVRLVSGEVNFWCWSRFARCFVAHAIPLQSFGDTNFFVKATGQPEVTGKAILAGHIGNTLNQFPGGSPSARGAGCTCWGRKTVLT